MADLVDVLWIVRFVLFCLGHFILFLPFPNKHTTCYHSAPLLWWALFVGLIYDWLRLAFMAIVCIIVIGIAIREIIAGLWMVSQEQWLGSRTAPALCFTEFFCSDSRTALRSQDGMEGAAAAARTSYTGAQPTHDG